MHFDSTILEKLGMPHALDAHPDLPLLLPEHLAAAGISAEQAVEMLRQRHDLIHKQRECPIYFGYEPESWRKCREMIRTMRERTPKGVLQVFLSGGNRSGKSEFAAKFVIQDLISAPRRRAWVLQATESASINEQHPYLWRYFPPEWKPVDTGKLRKGVTTNISYGEKTGFSGGGFVFPNGSKLQSKYYASDVATIEGAELNVCWADELIPLKWIDPLIYRLATRNGLLLITFTPVKGYNATAAAFLDGAEAVEEVELEIPVADESGNVTRWDRVTDRQGEWEKVPVQMRCVNPLRRVFYFHTMKNFYGGPDNVAATVAGSPLADVKLRLYGVPKQKAGSRFDWNDKKHVMRMDQVQALLRNAGTYTVTHTFDPAPGRNPFMQWWVTTDNGQDICVREWPQAGDYIPLVGDPGPWAVSGADADAGGTETKRELADGYRGPAQERFGLTLKQISAEVERVECELGALAGCGRLVPLDRYMDSRAANSPNYRASENTTLLIEFEELSPEDGKERALYFEPAPGGQKDTAGDDWITLINVALADHSDMGGAPGMLVAECCAATRFALKNWTGADGSDGACKDPVDCTKYFILSGPEHVPDQRAEGFQRKRRQTGY